MLFNSAIFIILFFFVYSIYWFLPVRGKHYLIIAASLAFYGWYSVPFLILFLVLLFFNYFVATQMLRKRSLALLIVAIVVDTGNLFLFKYFYLFAQSFGDLIGNAYLAHLKENWIQDRGLEIILPIGISFYTFQVIAYVVDCYRGVIKEHVPARQFFVFVLFFPHFVAGPIMRASDLIPQVNNPWADRDRILNGVLLILLGTAKKVLIADRIGHIIGDLWVNPGKYDATFILLALPGFVAQIYCDFSGYTDIARGLAKLLGFEIPENFKGPLYSSSVQELWQRWHITLSSWLRDYIYFPLGGSKVSEFRTSLNLIITMALAGFWHGATWTMLLWGIYMGLVLSGERFFRERGWRILPDTSWAWAMRHVKTLIVFTISALLFASPDLNRTFQMVNSILTFHRGNPSLAPETLVVLIFAAYVLNIIQNKPTMKEWLMARPLMRYATAVVSMFVIGLLVSVYGDVGGSFIYFQF